MADVLVLKNAFIFDGESEDLIENGSVVIKDGVISEVTDQPVNSQNANVIDCDGRYLMPGLIDAHFHCYSPTFDVAAMGKMLPGLLSQYGAMILEGALLRGFTTVRDAAGGDRAMWEAIERGLVNGPRFFFAGNSISQTGGHGDTRAGDDYEPCLCGSYHGALSSVADGEDAVRAAAREELRKGAHHLKVFLSGGIASPTDPLWMAQYTDKELRAAVEEAARRRTYVMAHCHTDEGANRCLINGVRSIEHGTEIFAETAEKLAEADIYVVPTLVVMDLLRQHGPDLNLPEMAHKKLKGVFETMMTSLETCDRAGVKLGFGTDLLDLRFHCWQGREFQLRGQVQKPVDILRSATSINAKMMNMSGQLGCIKEGAFGDVILLKNNPLNNLEQFAKPEESIPLILKGGNIVKNDMN